MSENFLVIKSYLWFFMEGKKEICDELNQKFVIADSKFALARFVKIAIFVYHVSIPSWLCQTFGEGYGEENE